MNTIIKQKGKVIWFTGLSGSGKTTLAKELQLVLNKSGYLTTTLDGDVVRTGINKDLGFSEVDRSENIRRIAEVSKLFIDAGLITINSFITPTEKMRTLAASIIKNDLITVFINTPLSICETRDVKGLYKKARNGELNNFTGIDAPFEYPINSDIEIMTENRTIEESLKELTTKIIPLL